MRSKNKNKRKKKGDHADSPIWLFKILSCKFKFNLETGTVHLLRNLGRRCRKAPMDLDF